MSDENQPSAHWIEDSTHYWGKVLDGKYAHWCPEWDDLPIDETCDEMGCCSCFEGYVHPVKDFPPYNDSNVPF